MRVVHPVLTLHELVQACGSLKISDYFVIRCISIPIKTVGKGLVSEPWAFNLKILRVPSAEMPGLAVRGGVKAKPAPWQSRLCSAGPQPAPAMRGCPSEKDADDK